MKRDKKGIPTLESENDLMAYLEYPHNFFNPKPFKLSKKLIRESQFQLENSNTAKRKRKTE